MSAHNELAREAEREFYSLAFPTGNYRHPIEEDDIKRRELMRPLIHAEWARRVQPVPITFEQPAMAEVSR